MIWCNFEFFFKDLSSHSDTFQKFLDSLQGEKKSFEDLRNSMHLFEDPSSWNDQALFFSHQNHRLVFRVMTFLSDVIF